MRLTIALSDERHQRLKATAAARVRTITQLIDESLEFYGIRRRRRPGNSWAVLEVDLPKRRLRNWR